VQQSLYYYVNKNGVIYLLLTVIGAKYTMFLSLSECYADMLSDNITDTCNINKYQDNYSLF